MFRIGRGKIFAGLDMGSHQIKAVFTEVDHAGKINVLSLSKGLSSGIKKGNIIDIDAVIATVNHVITRMEHFCGREVQETVLAISGLSIQTLHSHAAVASTGEEGEITSQDRQRLLSLVRNVALPEDKVILQVIEQQYIVDGNVGLRDPVGMIGNRVELEALVIIVNTLTVQNALRCASELGLEVSGMVYTPLLSALSVLSQAEQEMGVALVELGAQKMELSIFKRGVLEKSVVFPVGSDNITWDLAIVLKISNEEAKRVKENEKLLLSNEKIEGKIDKVISITSLNGSGVQEFPTSLIVRIMEARLEEMAQMLSHEIFSEYRPEEIPGGIVLTGGGANMEGIVEFFHTMIELPIRQGIPDRLEYLFHDYRSAENAAVLGCALWKGTELDNAKRMFSDPVEKFFRRITGWVREIME